MIEEVDYDGRTLILVGTAHVSPESIQDVETAIEDYEPDRICVELDESRLSAMQEEDKWRDQDVWETISRGDAYLLLFNVLLSIFQRRFGEEYDVRPGEEMMRAVDLAEEYEIPFETIDRDINITLKRALGQLSLLEKFRLLNSMLLGFFEPGEDIDIEELKEQDMLHEVISEFAGSFPRLKEVLIDERDVYMAERLKETEDETVLAVVGAGHMEGIIAHLREDTVTDTSELESIDTGINWFRGAKYAFPVLIASLLVYGFVNFGAGVAQDMLVYWVVFNVLFAAIGAIVAFSHPVTVIGGALASPLTSVNPAMPAGLVAAYIENRMRHPRVEDMEKLGEITSYRELWQNRATRLLLVFFLVNLGSSLGSFIAAGLMAQLSGLF